VVGEVLRQVGNACMALDCFLIRQLPFPIELAKTAEGEVGGRRGTEVTEVSA